MLLCYNQESTLYASCWHGNRTTFNEQKSTVGMIFCHYVTKICSVTLIHTTALMNTQNTPYQALLKTLQDKGSLSAVELKKVERVQKTAVAKSLPQLMVELGLCSELDVANAFVESGQFEKVSADQYPQEKQLSDAVSLRFLKNYHVKCCA